MPQKIDRLWPFLLLRDARSAYLVPEKITLCDAISRQFLETTCTELKIQQKDDCIILLVAFASDRSAVKKETSSRADVFSVFLLVTLLKSKHQRNTKKAITQPKQLAT